MIDAFIEQPTNERKEEEGTRVELLLHPAYRTAAGYHAIDLQVCELAILPGSV